MRLPRGLVVAALAAALVTPLSGCGSSEAGAAAVIGDRRISESDLQGATADISRLFASGGQAPSAREVLRWLVLAPYVRQLADENNVGVSDSDAKEIFTSRNFAGTPSPTAIEAVRSIVGLNAILGQNSALAAQAQQQVQQALVKDVTDTKIKISPRFGGTFDPATLQIAAAAPNWLPSPAPSATGTPAPSDSSAPAPSETTPSDTAAPSDTPTP